ncbi:MAG TPA: class D beta-lactamase, partial [bacterium]|nr:class D beta-lactamase [bacterium]
MKRYVSLLLLTIMVWGCGGQGNENWVQKPDFKEYFRQADVNGGIILYQFQRDTYLVYNPRRAKKRYIPASTFKIMNSLIALETGVIKNEAEVIPWDGVDRSIREWNADHNMRTAIRYSVLWFYQELARRVGKEQMQRYVELAGYGNKDIDGAIDQFWLTGDLRISPEEQVDFLARLYRNDLPFSQRSLDIVKDILLLETTDIYQLYGKTGWSQASVPQIGWFVGWLETAGEVYFFATNIDIIKPEDNRARFDV